MNVSELLKTNTIDIEDIKYAIKLSSENIFAECLKRNEIRNQGYLIDLINKKTFDKINAICVYSKIENEQVRRYINISKNLIIQEVNNLYNQIQKNLGTDTEIL